MCFMLLVFVAGIDKVSVRAGCITVGVLIHYFALVSWMFIGAEAVLLFHQAVIVLSRITWAYLLVFSIISWSKIVYKERIVCFTLLLSFASSTNSGNFGSQSRHLCVSALWKQPPDWIVSECMSHHTAIILTFLQLFHS